MEGGRCRFARLDAMEWANPTELRRLTTADAPACDAIIASLPYHFGQERGVEECAKAVRQQAGFVATIDGDVVGFLTFTNHWPESAEITWMAVSAEHRRRGIGRALIEYAVARLASQGTKFAFLLTLGPSVPDDVEDGYQGTRRFYEAVGFTPLREFGLRDWEDEAALLLVRNTVEVA
jgi:ribosomal protein S18 acetylase RimI-like enzyme